MFVYGLIILSRSLTGSDGFTGLVFLSGYLPALLFGPVAGTLLDRFSRLAIIHAAQTVYMFTGFALAVIIAAGWLTDSSSWILIGIAFLNGAALTFLIPGRLALLANLVPEGDAGRATVVLNVLIIVGFGLAPLVTGALKESLNWSELFLTIAGLYVLAWALLFFVRPQDYERRAPGNAFAAFREGAGFAFRAPLVREMLVFEMIVMASLGPLLVLMPQYARQILELSESGRGAFLSSLGAGLFFGGVLATALHRRRGRGWLMLAGGALMGLFLAWLVYTPQLAPAAIKLALCGLFGGAMGALIPAALQGAAPDYMRGRVMSLYGIIFQVLPGFSGLASGLIADQVGVAAAVQIMGLGVFALTVLAALGLRHLRAYD
jgi:MFS family permease